LHVNSVCNVLELISVVGIFFKTHNVSTVYSTGYCAQVGGLEFVTKLIEYDKKGQQHFILK